VSSPTTDQLAAVLTPTLEGLGLECYDIELSGSARARTLRVLIDRPGGVDLEAVTAATEALGPVLDADPAVQAALPGGYLLEVSSPGLERPLRTPAHFRRALGTPVSLKTETGPGGPRRERVLLVGADDEGIEVEVDGDRRRVAYAEVVQARTVFEWGPAAKPGKAAAGRPAKSTTPGAGAPGGNGSTPAASARH
jgi:ribosome maturation factor RimP